LDNTIRLVQTPTESEWILTDVIAEAASDGYGFGRVDCYAEDGTLLATATQTCICRRNLEVDLLA
jgi:acyl-CoA thioesterase